MCFVYKTALTIVFENNCDNNSPARFVMDISGQIYTCPGRVQQKDNVDSFLKTTKIGNKLLNCFIFI